jgi:hypothetical protein
METQKTHRRKMAVALLAGMFLAAPVFSVTAEAQNRQETPQQRRQRENTERVLEASRRRHANDEQRQQRENCGGQMDCRALPLASPLRGQARNLFFMSAGGKRGTPLEPPTAQLRAA